MVRLVTLLLAVFFFLIGAPRIRAILPGLFEHISSQNCMRLAIFFIIIFTLLTILKMFEKTEKEKYSLFTFLISLILTFLIIVYFNLYRDIYLDVNKYHLMIMLLINSFISYFAMRIDFKESKLENNTLVLVSNTFTFLGKGIEIRKIVLATELLFYLLMTEIFSYNYSSSYMHFLMLGWFIGWSVYIGQKFYENRLNRF